jgi:hypothetical protein
MLQHAGAARSMFRSGRKVLMMDPGLEVVYLGSSVASIARSTIGFKGCDECRTQRKCFMGQRSKNGERSSDRLAAVTANASMTITMATSTDAGTREWHRSRCARIV